MNFDQATVKNHYLQNLLALSCMLLCFHTTIFLKTTVDGKIHIDGNTTDRQTIHSIETDRHQVDRQTDRQTD